MDILPDSRLKNIATAKAAQRRIVEGYGAMSWVPIFCANCGADGGLVPEEGCNFAFYLCQPCADRWSPLSETYVEPDAVFWAKLKDAQLEKYGRELTAPEIIEALKDENSIFSKLAKERPK